MRMKFRMDCRVRQTGLYSNNVLKSSKKVKFKAQMPFDVCLSVRRCICVEKKNQLDATEWLIHM